MRTRCDQCGAEFDLPDAMLGASSNCLKCGRSIRIVPVEVRRSQPPPAAEQPADEDVPAEPVQGMENDGAAAERGPRRDSPPSRRDAATLTTSSDRRSEINWAPAWLARIVPVSLYIAAGATALLGFILGIAQALEYGGAILGLLVMLFSAVLAAALFALGFLIALLCELRDRMNDNRRS